MPNILKKVDKTFLITVGILVIIGFFTFSSASLGLLPRESVSVSKLFATQLILGLLLGSIALTITLFIPHKFYKRVAFYGYIAAVAATTLVFVPGLGITANGATRWLDLGGFSIQPAEFLKIGLVLYLATYLSAAKSRIKFMRTGLIPFSIILGIPVLILLLQPDTGTALVLIATAIAMYFAAGAPWRDIGLLGLGGVLGLGVLAAFRPYVLERFMTFLQPGSDPLGASYQIQQSLIAIGSGGIFGRGIGQSVQKFSYLPEPVGDSVFAVFAEEVGFIGALILLALFVALFTRGMNIATRAPNQFTALVVVGIVSSITFQSILNIGAMLGVFPLTGLPLIFVSHGGTALLVALASVGIILHISAHSKKG
ncbi:FtsW/RodA/SpoVE family cell cycle protein [Candidatus Wolfebacteria bacterium]|nr:FtsW/RodA/SpoVE family cell cycle protein [Candidatus Wolfebacteria bacterium]